MPHTERVKVIFFLALVLIVGFGWYFVKGRVTRTHEQVRDRALEGGFGRAVTAGPATKHLDMMGRTLTLAADPQRTGNLIASTAMADARVTDVRPEPQALVVEIDGSYPVVRAHLLADRTVVGVESFNWEMGFPQGGQVWDRIATAITNTAAHQGIPVAEGSREFVKDDTVLDREVWAVKS